VTTHTVTTHASAIEVLRNRDLRQALYDEGDVVMADVLVNLHGDEHRDRRRLENRLYRRETLLRYERELFPDILEQTLRPHVEAGRAELVGLGHQLMMNLAALTAGVDRPLGTPAETERLYGYLRTFIEGATLAHHVGDKAAKRAEVEAALVEFDAEFLAPSIARRRDLPAGERPRDVLTVLLENDDDLRLPHEVVRREIAFYLLAGAHTSATAFTRVLHHVFEWFAAHPDDRALATDIDFVQRCTYETIRLEPSSPVAVRRAEAPCRLADGTDVAAGDEVVVDLLAANRDPDVWGVDADDFDPWRTPPDRVPAWGLSLGSGMHHCIGGELATGAMLQHDRLHGLVPTSVLRMLELGCEPDPAAAPERDLATARPYFARYPVVFRR
jgi:cytochrome P450